MAATIHNPELSYEDRARLRKEKRLNLKIEQLDRNAVSTGSPVNLPFRTRSPTVERSHSPILGHMSEYAYVSSLSSSPRSSPSPSRKTFQTKVNSTNAASASKQVSNVINSHERSTSEPPYLSDVPTLETHSNSMHHSSIPTNKGSGLNEKTNGSIIHGETDFSVTPMNSSETDNSKFFQYNGEMNPRPIPMMRPYDSRTPRLARGALKNTNIVYRKDLNDFKDQDITVVMFPRDITLERPQHSSNDKEDLPSSQISSSDESSGRGNKKGMMIVPAVSVTKEPKDERSGKEKKDNEKKSSKDGKRVSKRFSFLGGLGGTKEVKKQDKEKENVKKSPKLTKKKSNQKNKRSSKMSSGGLSMLSMPNLTPTSPEFPSDTSDSGTSPLPPKTRNYLLFGRSNNREKKPTHLKTSWTFQQPFFENNNLTPTRSEMSLQTIGESTDADLPTYDMIAKTMSMECLPQLITDPPLTVFQSHSTNNLLDSDEEDEELNMFCPGEKETRSNLVESPVSMRSISVEIPDLTDYGNASPLPTCNEITSGSDLVIMTTQPFMNSKEEDVQKKEETQKQEVMESDLVRSTEEMSEDWKISSDSLDGNVEDKKFSRFSNSRKPVRKQSFGGKDSPALIKNRSPSFKNKMTNTSEGLTDDGSNSPLRSISRSISPSKISLSSNSPSPQSTPTFKRNTPTYKSTPTSSPKTPTQIHVKKSLRVRKQSSKDSPQTTPINSPLNTPTSIHKFKSSLSSPTSSPTPSRGGKTSPLTKSNSTRKVVKSTLTVPVNKSTPRLNRKSVDSQKTNSTPNKPTTLSDQKSQSPQSLTNTPSRRRKLGITSVTSPIVEERGLDDINKSQRISKRKDSGDKIETGDSVRKSLRELKRKDSGNSNKNKIIPKRPAPSPPSEATQRRSLMDLDVNEMLQVSTPEPEKQDNSSSSNLALEHNTTLTNSSLQSSNTETTNKTYVYQTTGKKDSTPQIPELTGKKENVPVKTYKYESAQQRKRKSVPVLEHKSPTGKKSPSRLTPVKTPPPSPGGKRTPVSPRSTPSNSSLLKNKEPRRSLPVKSIKVNDKKDSGKLSTSEERGTSGRLSPTLNILNPLDYLLSSSISSVEQGTHDPQSPPFLDSMLARPFSPTSPHLSQDDGDISLTPEVPIWSDPLNDSTGHEGTETKNGTEDQDPCLTYIYRSTLLRKGSRVDITDSKPGMVRSPSNKSLGSPHHEAGAKQSTPLSRTSSPRKTSVPVLGSPTRQSKKSISGSPIRKGSNASQMTARRPSSGVSRPSLEKVSSGTGTLNRPRSANQMGLYPSLRRPSKSSSMLSSRGQTRVSVRSKNMSTDSIPLNRKPSTGTRKSLRKPVKLPSTESPDSSSNSGTPTSSPRPPHLSRLSKDIFDVTSGSKPTNLPTHKPPLGKSYSGTTMKAKQHSSVVVTKSQRSSSLTIENKTNESRKSIRVSKTAGKLQNASLFTKPPSGTLGRSSIRNPKSSVDSMTSRNSLRRSHRSSVGTITKVSQFKPTQTNSSPTHHHTLTRTSSKDDTLKAFDHVSSMAQKTTFSTVADHKRSVRPLMRQKPSSSHLQMLNKRNDVSSEMDTSTSNPDMLDPNSYSTYMGKKVLDQSALAGLAAKLDFTTVKLRKTGIVEQMMSDQKNSAGGPGSGNRSVIEDPTSSYGVQVTQHPHMLLMIKGRRHVQTRIVEPMASSLNSGDVFILVSAKELFIWLGKEANVIEKARANDIVTRIYQKRELGCRCNGFTRIEDENNKEIFKKEESFWEMLKGKPESKKAIGLVPSDESYEKGVVMATKIYQYICDGDVGKFVLFHNEQSQMLKISILDTKKILLFDFYSEVYVWFGKHSPQAQRKHAMMKGRKHFDMGCFPPSFGTTTTSSPARKMSGAGRASGRSRSKVHQRHGTLNSSTRRRTLERKPSKEDLKPRPSWALFARVNEGSETILFREKFADWPEPGRIIKMKGHESSGEVIKPPPMPELVPADVSQMLKSQPKFEGLRLEGENIHRGHGNYKVSRSTFACNRVHSQDLTKYHIKEFDNVVVTKDRHGIFYSGEGYVFRWAYTITVVRELEGLTPGEGLFAKDRKYQKESLEKQLAKQHGVNRENGKTSDSPSTKRKMGEDDSSDEEVNESDDETRRFLESGGRDRCAYFFWQGERASINEKGAAALMTVELDKERGPQIRVVQGKEYAAFLQLFKGSLIILYGKSDNNDIEQCQRGYRLYYVRGAARKEGHLIEINIQNESLSYYLRSRGCYILQYMASSSLYVWIGCKATDISRSVALHTARNLKRRLTSFKVVKVMEGSEPKEMQTLMGDRSLYLSLLKIPDPVSYTPRLFHLSSSSGWFVASEEIHMSKPDSEDTPDSFPFIQENIYDAVQPTLFLLDAHSDIYVWMGWWPQQKNKLLQEKNAFSGTAQSHWARDKKLALQTALNYAEACKRSTRPKVYVVNAGTEPIEFTNLFPSWNENKDVQDIVCKGTPCQPNRIPAEKELAKYTRKTYTVEELRKRPEEVDQKCLETYLSDKDFVALFKMSRDEFSKLLSWKKVNMKKQVDLF